MQYHFMQIEKRDFLCMLLAEERIFDLYKDCFSTPPYEEIYDKNEINNLFLDYFEKGILLLCFEQENEEIIGFAAAIPLKFESEISNLAKNYGFDSSKDWYYSDVGVARKYRRNGIAYSLATNLLSLIPANKIIMRTQENNVASQACHMSIGFRKIDGMHQYITKRRISGDIKIDKRIFLFYEKKASRDNFEELFERKVNDYLDGFNIKFEQEKGYAFCRCYNCFLPIVLKVYIDNIENEFIEDILSNTVQAINDDYLESADYKMKVHTKSGLKCGYNCVFYEEKAEACPLVFWEVDKSNLHYLLDLLDYIYNKIIKKVEM